MMFRGFNRPDGRIGVRNHVLILPTVVCANETCRIIAETLPEAISIVNQNGCGEVDANRIITQTVLSGLAANPNVFGTLMIGLGCETNQADSMAEIIRSKTDKPLKILTIQEEGGTINTINKGVRIAQDMIELASRCRRESVDISHLMLGLECGGSDSTSGLVANPVMGQVSDLLVDLGGTSVLSETTELIGAEHLLAQRAVTPEVGQKIVEIVENRETQLHRIGEDVRSGQPSHGNKAGGISTIEEKSMGCIHKGGTRPVMEVVDYAEAPGKKGFVIMDTPGYDVLSVTAKVAGGCQLILFSTGRGNPVGNPIAPVVKVTANKETFDRMRDNIDLDFSDVLSGTRSIETAGNEVLKEIVDIANGKKTRAEILGFGFTETVMSRVCDYI